MASLVATDSSPDGPTASVKGDDRLCHQHTVSSISVVSRATTTYSDVSGDDGGVERPSYPVRIAAGSTL